MSPPQPGWPYHSGVFLFLLMRLSALQQDASEEEKLLPFSYRKRQSPFPTTGIPVTPTEGLCIVA